MDIAQRRSSGLPCMWGQLWPLQRLQQLRVVPIVPVLSILLLVGGERGWPEQRRWVRQKRKGALVGSRFVSAVHA
ncbi:MAG: hypothetical protein STSR0002_25760 [Smithella sp.]